MKRVGEERKMDVDTRGACFCVVLECVYHCVCNGKKHKRGYNDEILTLITVVMATKQGRPDDKNTEKQPEPPIDVWLTTL